MTKKEFDQKLKELGLTRKTFATLTDISYKTTGNWSDENRPVPTWVKSWLENYEAKIKLELIKKTLEKI